MERASFRDVKYLLIGKKHAIPQGLRFIHQNICVHIDSHVWKQFLITVLNVVWGPFGSIILIDFGPILAWVRMDGHEFAQLLSAQLFVPFPEQLSFIRFNLFAQLFLRFDDKLKLLKVAWRFKFKTFLEFLHTVILGPYQLDVVHWLVKDRYILGLHLL